MSNIQGPRGLQASPLQTSSKQDGGGNGQGGMYFGQYPEQEEENWGDSFRWRNADLDDIPFTVPVLIDMISSKLKVWKTALAKMLYTHTGD